MLNAPRMLGSRRLSPSRPAGTMTISKRGLSHVARLLEDVLVEAQIAPSRLAQLLGIATDQLQAYCSGAERMSTDQQIDLATLVLVQYPNCARLAHRVAA